MWSGSKNRVGDDAEQQKRNAENAPGRTPTGGVPLLQSLPLPKTHFRNRHVARGVAIRVDVDWRRHGIILASSTHSAAHKCVIQLVEFGLRPTLPGGQRPGRAGLPFKSLRCAGPPVPSEPPNSGPCRPSPVLGCRVRIPERTWTVRPAIRAGRGGRIRKKIAFQGDAFDGRSNSTRAATRGTGVGSPPVETLGAQPSSRWTRVPRFPCCVRCRPARPVPRFKQ